MSLNDETPPGKHGAYKNPFKQGEGVKKKVKNVVKKGKHSKKKKPPPQQSS